MFPFYHTLFCGFCRVSHVPRFVGFVLFMLSGVRPIPCAIATDSVYRPSAMTKQHRHLLQSDHDAVMFLPSVHGFSWPAIVIGSGSKAVHLEAVPNSLRQLHGVISGIGSTNNAYENDLLNYQGFGRLLYKNNDLDGHRGFPWPMFFDVAPIRLSHRYENIGWIPIRESEANDLLHHLWRNYFREPANATRLDSDADRLVTALLTQSIDFSNPGNPFESIWPMLPEELVSTTTAEIDAAFRTYYRWLSHHDMLPYRKSKYTSAASFALRKAIDWAVNSEGDAADKSSKLRTMLTTINDSKRGWEVIVAESSDGLPIFIAPDNQRCFAFDRITNQLFTFHGNIDKFLLPTASSTIAGRSTKYDIPDFSRMVSIDMRVVYSGSK